MRCPSPLPTRLPRAPRLQRRLCPSRWRCSPMSWRSLCRRAAALPCPPDFAAPLLAVLGAAIGTTRVVEIKPGWRESPQLWTAVVADPGSKKSPALELVMRPLYRAQQRLKTAYAQRMTVYEPRAALRMTNAMPPGSGRSVRRPTTYLRSLTNLDSRNFSARMPRSRRWRGSWSRTRAGCCSSAMS